MPLLACCSLHVSPCTENITLGKNLIVVQAGVATDKAYARKLEAKLSASKSISDLHARCSQYKLKLRELAQELDEAESRTASVQEIADVRADEVHISNASLAHKVHKNHVMHREVMGQSGIQHKALIKLLQMRISELPGPAMLSACDGSCQAAACCGLLDMLAHA